MTTSKISGMTGRTVRGEKVVNRPTPSGDDTPPPRPDHPIHPPTTSTRTTVMIVDDHPVFRRGLYHVITEDPDFEVVAEAGDGERALALIQQWKPQVAILDLGLPKVDGLEVVRRLRRESGEVRLIILTMSLNEAVFNEALDQGVNGYVLKDDAVTDILKCLHALVEGKPYVSPAISGLLLRRAERSRELRQQNPTLAALTPMERRILKLIAQNKTSKEIAAELFISVYTVETHRCNICGKLELQGAQPVLRFALEHRSEL